VIIKRETMIEGWQLGGVISSLCTSSLSILGCIFILVSACIFGRVKLPYWRLVLGLTVADFGGAMTVLVGGASLLAGGSPPSGAACRAEGFIVETFAETSNLYILSISIFLYVMVVLQQTLTWKWEIVFHLFPWLFSIVQGIIPLTEVDGIRYVWLGGWCWVDSKPTYARFISFYIVAWAVMVCILLIYIRVWWKIRSDRRDYEYTLVTIAKGKREENQLILSIILFTSAFIILWLPSTINRIYEAVNPPSPALTVVQVAFTPLQGAIDSIVYGFTAGIFGEIKNYITGRLLTHTEGEDKSSYVLAEEVPIKSEYRHSLN
jgi:hypothetical protein